MRFLVDNLLTVDPGSAGAGCACAHFHRGYLFTHWFEAPTAFRLGAPPPSRKRPRGERPPPFDVVFVERPEYQGDRSDKARTQDLINLSWDGGSVARAFAGRDECPVCEATPTEWKGQEPKPIQHARLWDECLTVAEQAKLPTNTREVIEAAVQKGALKRWSISGAECYPKRFVLHNILDAVAMGCVYLGRFKKPGRHG